MLSLRLFPKTSAALPATRDDDEREEGWEEDFERREKHFSALNDHLLALRQASFEKSDELIITISSAFLALSIGFIKEIVPLARSIWLPLLVVSWVCFFAAIATNFVSHFWARKAIEDQIDCARFYYLEGRSKYLDPDLNIWTRRTERCNLIAAVLFGLGVFLTLFFVSANVLKEHYFPSAKPKIATARPIAQGAKGSSTAPNSTRAAPPPTPRPASTQTGAAAKP